MAGSIPYLPITVPQEGLPAWSRTVMRKKTASSGSDPGWTGLVSRLALST